MLWYIVMLTEKKKRTKRFGGRKGWDNMAFWAASWASNCSPSRRTAAAAAGPRLGVWLGEQCRQGRECSQSQLHVSPSPGRHGQATRPPLLVRHRVPVRYWPSSDRGGAIL